MPGPTLRAFVFCDSVIGGSGNAAPAVQAAFARLEHPAEIEVAGAPYRLVTQQLGEVDRAVAFKPDVAIVSHGGAEVLKVVRPPGAGVLANAGGPTAFQRRTRANRVLRHARAQLRRLRPVPPSPVTFAEFELAYRTVVERLLRETSAVVVLLAPMGSDTRFVPTDETFRAQVPALLDGLATDDRVMVVHAGRHLRRWEDFRSDRAHLSWTGHATVGRILAEALAPVLLTAEDAAQHLYRT